jgi:hypothetical protein
MEPAGASTRKRVAVPPEESEESTVSRLGRPAIHSRQDHRRLQSHRFIFHLLHYY